MFGRRIILFALTILAMGNGVTMAANGPRLEVEPILADFGKIRQGAQVEQIFHLKNTGDAPLVIGQVKTSCGCTAALPSKTSFAPGEEGEIRAVFNSKGFSGEIKKSIYVYSNDKSRTFMEVVMHGQVVPEIEVSPTVLEAGTVEVGTTQEVQAEIFNHGATPLALKRIEVLATGVEVPFEEQTIPAGGSVRLLVKITPPAGSERVTGYLVVHTDRADLSIIRIPIYAAVSASQH